MAKVLKSPSARANWRDVLDQVKEADVVVERYGSPVVAIIPYADYSAIREQLENLRAVRQAQSAYAEARQGQAAGDPRAIRAIARARPRPSQGKGCLKVGVGSAGGTAHFKLN